MEWTREGYTVSTDKSRLDIATIHAFLAEAYWSKGRTREAVVRSIANSALCFGLYAGQRQVGFARVVSDLVSHYWVCDVFVLPEYRRRGLATWMMECVVSSPELQGMRGILATRDARGLYEKVGFQAPEDPRRLMWRIAGTHFTAERRTPGDRSPN